MSGKPTMRCSDPSDPDRNTKSHELYQQNEINGELIGSHSPNSAVQIGSLPSTSNGPIRLRPLIELLSSDASSISDDDDVVILEDGEEIDEKDRTGELPIVVDAEDSNWKLSCRGVMGKLKFILDHDDSYQDVTFLVGKDSIQRISGHRLILRLGSDKLEKLFSETSDVGQIIPVPEVEPLIFKHILKYIYTDEFDPVGLLSSDVIQILEGAKLLEVHHLVHNCVQTLKDNISDDNAVVLCELAGEIQDSELKDLAISHICRNARSILSSTYFLDFTYLNLLLLIGKDDLELDEVLIFKAVLKWGESSCRKINLEIGPHSLRKVLNRILYKIRFPIMSAEQIYEVEITKLLLLDELLEIYRCLCLGDSARDHLGPPLFSSKLRNYMSKKSDPSIKDVKEDSNLGKLTSESEQLPNCYYMVLPSTSNETKGEGCSSPLSSQSTPGSSTARPSKKRPRLRSPSSSHSKEPKMVITLSDYRALPVEFTEQTSIDSELVIHLENCEIELNEFINECSNNPRRNEIECIRLCRVKVTDHDKLQGTRVWLPKLKELYLDIIIPNLKHINVNNFARKLVLKQFLFFSIKEKLNWSLNSIWSLCVNISLIINGITIVKIDHDQNQLVINNLRETGQILYSSSVGAIVKCLIFSNTLFSGSPNLFPRQYLEQLVLFNITKITTFNNLLRRFTRLKELCILSTKLKMIDLGNDLVSPYLKKLAVGRIEFSFSLQASVISLEELFVCRCEWSASFEDNFHHIFPNLKKVSFFMNKTSPKLLKNIMKITSIEEIWFRFGTFDSSNTDSEDLIEIKKIIVSAGLSENERSFILKKTNFYWEGRKVSLDVVKQEMYKIFHFYQLYGNDYGFKGWSILNCII